MCEGARPRAQDAAGSLTDKVKIIVTAIRSRYRCRL
jgi:hypothetical protein